MDERVRRVATLANVAYYDEEATRKYVDGAPHIKHESLRKLYGQLVVEVLDNAKSHAEMPRVLDLGAGEGGVTLPFLELGARVVAVDMSEAQLGTLKTRCKNFAERLEVRCQDANDALEHNEEKFDIIVVNSFLHHVPDYLALIKKAVPHLNPHGQFFSFQDPLRYDSLGKLTALFSVTAFFSWRIFQGDVWGGLKRRIRRHRRVYDDSVHDNAEYHVTRNGVDQDAIRSYLKEQGFDCRVISYFSTQSSLFQPIGEILGVKNTFAILAKR